MDLGVGSFVFSQGIISAIPLIKDPLYLTSSLPSKLFKVTQKSLPVIVLGLVRVLLVKGTEYPVSIQPPVIFYLILIVDFRNMKRSMEGIGISSLLLPLFLSYKFYCIP